MVMSFDDELHNLGKVYLAKHCENLTLEGVRYAKNLCVKTQSFERAAYLRDIEKQMMNGKDPKTIIFR